ncbi:hypothetical protein AVEN_51765-1 [Araneus ventricosus]|uniref:HAT C-terminal dimerisation domain-containing protein n=1 Tax=Araneus ventricosus TaxID=182803 RepID=A0A4Y2J7J5_ARAVE|nr:hypothetical protein AVEN_51765-1 [Araneus ventricosus]
MFEKFPDNEYGWIRDSFPFDIFESNITLNEEEQLIEVPSDGTLSIQFKCLAIKKFWLSIGNDYADLKKKAIKILIQFSSTYLWGTGFSKLVAIKTKYRTRLDPEDDFRFGISNTYSNLEAIMNSLQPHTLH